ncbi:MAG: SAM-dependent methyltransferase [Bacteroidia bacterium]|nr:SAM-dependent methyltransferase [Bacteroidia bacterium]
MPGKLFLIPVFLEETASSEQVFPAINLDILNHLSHFIAENDKLARRFLKRVNYQLPLSDAQIELLNEHTKTEEVFQLLQPALQGINMGLLSDAGCPGVADPGALVVQLAHDLGITVEPLIGPSSILLSLMASGMNGQQFTFHGYLPIDKIQRARTLKDLSNHSIRTGHTQLFIETPYRNQAIFEDILKNCSTDLRLCIACNLTASTGWTKSMSIQSWKNKKPDIHKKPCIFLIGR